MTEQNIANPTQNFPGKFTRSIREVIGSWKTLDSVSTKHWTEGASELGGSKYTSCPLTVQCTLGTWHWYGCPTPLHISLVSNWVNYWLLPMSVQSMLLLEAYTTPCRELLKVKRMGGWWLEETKVCALLFWHWTGREQWPMQSLVCCDHQHNSWVCGFPSAEHAADN